MRNVGAERNIDANACSIPLVHLILSQALADLAGGASHNVVGVGVVVGGAPKDFDSDDTFLEALRSALQSLLDNVPKQCRVALTVPKNRAEQDLLQFFPDRVAVLLCLRRPRRCER